MRVSVERASGRPRVQQGLVVSDGAVLTVLDPMEEIASLSVTVSGRGVFTAELERFDVRTGAALLSVGAEGLALAPGGRRTVAPGEPVLLLSRDGDGGELVVKETYASPSLNAPDHLVALHGDYTPSSNGAPWWWQAMAYPSVLQATRGHFTASRSFLADLPLSTCQQCFWTPRSGFWNASLQMPTSPPPQSPTTGRT